MRYTYFEKKRFNGPFNICHKSRFTKFGEFILNCTFLKMNTKLYNFELNLTIYLIYKTTFCTIL